MERETGIEPASLAWKAKVLPLNYSRKQTTACALACVLPKLTIAFAFGGEGWIRTSVGVSQQIYSLPPLATRAPLRKPCIMPCSYSNRQASRSFVVFFALAIRWLFENGRNP
ncbi:MAG: hypothetical protein RLZZ612_735 [Pseudomonadota bacterium]